MKSNIDKYIILNLDESDEISLNDLGSFTIGYQDENCFCELAVHETLREDKAIASKVNEISYLFTDFLKKRMSYEKGCIYMKQHQTIKDDYQRQTDRYKTLRTSSTI